MSNLATSKDRAAFHFDWKIIVLVILLQILVLLFFRDAIYYSLKDPFFLPWLVGANIWAIAGLAACSIPTEEKPDYSRMQFWVVFVAPLTGVFVGSYCIEYLNKAQTHTGPSTSFSNQYFMDVRGDLHKIDRTSSYKPQYITAARAIPVFFARHDIAAGATISFKDVYAAGANENEEDGRILANLQTYVEADKSIYSILARKAKHMISKDASIKNSDIEPPYTDEFVLQETK